MTSDIIEEIHKSDPLPKGKIDQSEDGLTEEESKCNYLDSQISDVQKSFAWSMYRLLSQAYLNTPLPEESIALQEAQLQLFIRKEPITEETSEDLKFKKWATDILNPSTKKLYACQILKALSIDVSQKNLDKKGKEIADSALTVERLLGTIKGKEDQLALLRSINHELMLQNGQTNSVYYDGINKLNVVDDKVFEKVIPDVWKEYKSAHLNGGVDTGLSPAIINGLIDLLNKYVTCSDGKKISIKKIPISSEMKKDKALNKLTKSIKGAVDKAKSSSVLSDLKGLAANPTGTISGKIVNAVSGMISKAMGESIIDVAQHLYEETEQSNSQNSNTENKEDNKPKDSNEEMFQTLKNAYPDQPFAQFNSYKDLVDSCYTSNQKEVVKNDEALADKIKQVSNGSGEKFHMDYLNPIIKDQKQLNNLFDLISRPMYRESKGKMSLYETDSKANYAFSTEWPEFKTYINTIESSNRSQEDDDNEVFKENWEDTEYDATVKEYKQDQKEEEEANNEIEAFSSISKGFAKSMQQPQTQQESIASLAAEMNKIIG